MIIDKWDYRVLDVIDAGIEFMLESDVVVVYTDTDIKLYKDKLIEDLWFLFNNAQSDIIVSYDNDILAGFALIHKDELFSLRPVGLLNKFYVRKSFRGTQHGRLLTKECVGWFDDNGIIDSFVTSTAGIGENKQFENLFRKYGFTIIGSCMRRTHA